MMPGATVNHMNANKSGTVLVNDSNIGQLNSAPSASTGARNLVNNVESGVHLNGFNGNLPQQLCEEVYRHSLVNKLLPNANIERSQFLNVVDFGHNDNISKSCLDDQWGNDDMEEGSIYSGMEENYETASRGSKVSLLEQSLEINSDLFEQQQAVEQARLLQCFQELRMHQAQQQEELMRRHQQQLKSLYAENQETQHNIVKQRQAAWGKPTNPSTVEHLSGTSSGCPSKPKPMQPGNALPKAIAQTSIAMPKTNSGASLSALVNLQSLISLPVKVQKGRPLPVFRDAIMNSDDLDSVSVCAESEFNSVDSPSEIDGICPLPDSGSEISEIRRENVSVEAVTSAACVRRNLGFKGNRSPCKNISQKNFADKDVEQSNQESSRRQCFVNANVEKVNTRVRSPMEISAETDEEMSSGLPDHKEEMLERPPLMLDRNITSKHNCLDKSLSNRAGVRALSGEEINASSSDVEEYEEEQVAHDVMNRDSCSSEEQNEVDLNFDEKPVSGLGGKKKTFEELLEEELSKEQQNMHMAQSGTCAHVSPKRTFLRKGQGLTKLKKHSSQEPRVQRHSAPVASTTKRPPARWPTQQSKALHAKGKSLAVKETYVPVAKLQLKEPLRVENGSSGISKAVGAMEPAVSAGQSNSVSSVIVGQSATNVGPVAVPVPSDCSRQTDLKVKVVAGTGLPQQSNLGDNSFQQCLMNMAQKEEVELDELEEFELLEQYAEDNASFLSNVSAVNRVVGHHKEMMKNKINVAKRVSRNSAAEEDASADDISDSTSVVSSTEDSEAEASSNEDEDENDKLDSTLKDETALHFSLEKSRNSAQQQESRNSHSDEPRIMQRKVALTKRNPENYTVSGSDNDDEKLCHTDSGADLWNKNQEAGCTGLMLAQEHISALPKRDDSAGSDIAGTFNNRKINKCSLGLDARQVGTVPSFEDDISWEETATARMEELENRSKCRNSASLKAKEQEFQLAEPPPVLGGDLTAGPDNGQKLDAVIPPTSKLVSKLFPKLRPDPPKPMIEPQHEQKLLSVKQSEIGDGLQSKLLREKLLELENEIQTFRQENAALAKLRKEREEGLEMLKKEMAEFDKQKTAELNRLQEFKAEELKKLRKEKKVFEQYQKSMCEQPNKKEREEIEALKSQLEKLQEEQRKKEQRWTASTSRLRDRIEQLEREKMELKEENQLLEQRRLEVWQTKKTTDTITSAPPFLRTTPEEEGDGVLILPNVARPPSRIKQNIPEPVVKLNGSAELSRTLAAPKASVTTSGSDGRRSTLSAVKKDAIGESELVNQMSRSLGSQATRTSCSPLDFPDNFVKPADITKSVTRKTASIITTNVTNSLDRGDNQYKEVKHSDGKVERIFTNGMREIIFSNGTRKQVSADGQSIIVSFFNGDIKQILPDQRIVYYYADAQTTHTTYPDGLQILQFPNQQTEKHYPDGTKEITFPDRTIKYVFPSGVEESVFQDGTTIRVEKNGDKVMEFPNGQREIHTQAYKRREYPDGTVKTVYPDGRQETRYSSGRMRVKDKDGNVIVDKQL